MTRSRRSKSMCGIGVVVLLLASTALLWPGDPAGAIPLESWDDQIPNARDRFKVLSEFGDQAVLDKETALVWERTPDTQPQPWVSAKFACLNKIVGNRRGWRLPSIVELSSLVDPSVNTAVTLPAGHPLVGIQPAIYWSATTDSEFLPNAFLMVFSNGGVGGGPKTDPWLVWCVRGGMHAPPY
jgi:hypothetical protein